MSTTTPNTRPHYAHVVEIEGKIVAVFASRFAAVKYLHDNNRYLYDGGVNITKWNTTTGERIYGRAKLKTYWLNK